MNIIRGDDLKRMRLAANKTTVDIAKVIGVSRITYENWEKDIGQPKINQFLIIGSYCSINLKPLLNQFNLLKKQLKNIRMNDENNTISKRATRNKSTKSNEQSKDQ
ncbi:MAG: helix-turn-helix transcriptional regulator [Colwellia sp.]|nr:helix-turn-helix transcriptional regulator [Colwellia sp.]